MVTATFMTANIEKTLPQVRTDKNDFYLSKAFMNNAGEIFGLKKITACLIIVPLLEKRKEVTSANVGDAFEINYLNYFKVIGKKISENKISFINIYKSTKHISSIYDIAM